MAEEFVQVTITGFYRINRGHTGAYPPRDVTLPAQIDHHHYQDHHITLGDVLDWFEADPQVRFTDICGDPFDREGITALRHLVCTRKVGVTGKHTGKHQHTMSKGGRVSWWNLPKKLQRPEDFEEGQ